MPYLQQSMIDTFRSTVCQDEGQINLALEPEAVDRDQVRIWLTTAENGTACMN